MSDDQDTTANGSAQSDEQIVAGMVDKGQPAPGTPEAKYFYADEVAGEGEPPDWFKSEKYKTISDQAKGYKELESRFGSFTGAPDEYTPVELSEEFKERGVEIAADDPLLEKAIQLGKELNMNQEGFEKMITLYAETIAAENIAMQDYQNEQMRSLGQNAESRINNLNAWASANLPTELMEGFQHMATTAESVKALEKIVAMTRSAPINPDNIQPTGGVTSEELRQMQFEKDEHGNRRLQTDPDFKKRFNELSKRVWGSDDHTITIG